VYFRLCDDNTGENNVSVSKLPRATIMVRVTFNERRWGWDMAASLVFQNA
jgi:hypothetical protein